MSLNSLPIKMGLWSHSDRFFEVHTAHEWDLKPSQFYASSPDDKALMMAYVKTREMMSAWESQEQERKARASAAKAKNRAGAGRRPARRR